MKSHPSWSWGVYTAHLSRFVLLLKHTILSSPCPRSDPWEARNGNTALGDTEILIHLPLQRWPSHIHIRGRGVKVMDLLHQTLVHLCPFSSPIFWALHEDVGTEKPEERKQWRMELFDWLWKERCQRDGRTLQAHPLFQLSSPSSGKSPKAGPQLISHQPWADP